MRSGISYSRFQGRREVTKLASNREAELLRQQTVLAQFGELALRYDGLDDILHEPCRLVGEALGIDLAKVMELQEDGVTPRVRAGICWPPGLVGKVVVDADAGTSEGHALHTGQPVISASIDDETRFRYAQFLKDAGVKALVNVIIIGADGHPPYGILQVDSRCPRAFTEHDISFLRSYANLLAAAVERRRIAGEAAQVQAALRQIESSYRVIIETPTDYAIITLDLVTDVGLPNGMNGRQVAKAVRQRRPGLPVLFITGYSGSALPSGTEIIRKPFVLDSLARRIQTILAAKP